MYKREAREGSSGDGIEVNVGVSCFSARADILIWPWLVWELKFGNIERFVRDTWE